MFNNLFGKKEEPEAKNPVLCSHANENPEFCYCTPDCACFEGTCEDRVPYHTRKDGQIVYVQPPTDNCLMCGAVLKDAHWKYVWKGKDGYMCRDTCGRDFHAIGDYLLEKAAKIMKDQGIEVLQTKEKFGIMMMYTGAKTELEHQFVTSFAQTWRERYPEFEWSFS
jgi:hypothetical protein